MSGEDNNIVALEAAAKVAEETQQPISDVVELSNGIRLRYKSVPQVTLRHSLMIIPKPDPPMVENPEKGRSEPWEGDPKYQESLNNWLYQIGETTLNVMLMLGTKLEFVPEGVDGPKDEGWVELLEAAGVPIKINTEPARYLSWLRFYALAEPEDVTKVSQAVARRSGVLEQDVDSALQSFRGGKNGGTNLEPATKKRRSHRNNLSPSDGGAGSGSGGT